MNRYHRDTSAPGTITLLVLNALIYFFTSIFLKSPGSRQSCQPHFCFLWLLAMLAAHLDQIEEVPPPKQTRFLSFRDPAIEARYNEFVRRPLVTISPFVMLGSAMSNAEWLWRTFPSLPISCIALFGTATFLLFVASGILFYDRKLFIPYGGWCSLPSMMGCCGMAASWGVVSGSMSHGMSGVIFFSYFFAFFSTSAFWSILNVLAAMTLQNYYSKDAVFSLESLLYSRSYFYGAFTILACFVLEITFRRNFSWLYVIEKYNEQLTDSIMSSHSGSFPAANSEYEMMRKTLQTAQSVNEALRRKTEEVEKAMLAKEQFMATMSHEIRSPLHSIIALSSLLVDTSLVLGDEERSMLKTINTSSEHLMTIVNDILDYSRMQARKMELVSEKFNLHSFVEGVVGILSPLIHQGVHFVSTVNTIHDIELIGDSARLKQICCNLLSNAAKFTHKGSVGFYVEVEEDKSNPSAPANVSFRVVDTGIGMSDEYLQKMYTPFEQSDNTISRKYGGTGLGLVITKQLVGLFQGKIKCESSLGQGTKFSLMVPLQRAPPKMTTGSNFSSPPLIVPEVAVIAFSMFVLDSALPATLQDAIRKWLELAGGIVLSQSEYEKRKSGQKSCRSSPDYLAMDTGGSTLRLRRTTTARSGDGGGGDDGNGNNNSSSNYREFATTAAEAVADIEALSSCSAPPVRISSNGGGGGGGGGGRSDDGLKSVICVCLEEREEAMMVQMGCANGEGRVLVIVKGRAAEAAAILHAASATAATPQVVSSPISDSSRSPVLRASIDREESLSNSTFVLPPVSTGPSSTGRTYIIDANGCPPDGEDVVNLDITVSVSPQRSKSGDESSGGGFRRIDSAVVDDGNGGESGSGGGSNSGRSNTNRKKGSAWPASSIQQLSCGRQRSSPMMLNVCPWQRCCVELPLLGSTLLQRAVEIVLMCVWKKKRMNNPLDSSNNDVIDTKGKITIRHDNGQDPSVRGFGLGSRLLSAPSPKASPSLANLRVLLVDDNSINRKVGEKLLHRCGITKVELAGDGLQALLAVENAILESGGKKRGFDIVLMDLHMPVMDGATSAREIVKRVSEPKLRPVVVACTADVFAANNDSLPLSITKPFTAPRLASTLEECLAFLKQKREREK